MKYKNEIIAFCVCVLVATLVVLVIFLLDMFGTLSMPSGSLIVLCITLIGLLLLSFTAVCILLSFYDDWKWRRLKKNERWR